MILKNKTDLKLTVKNLKEDKTSFGAISGTFDLLHNGHKEALNYSGSRVSKLFVLVNSDTSVKVYKGEHRPIDNQLKIYFNTNLSAESLIRRKPLYISQKS